MDQNNNTKGYNFQTEQSIYENQNTNIQQPTQTQPPKKSKKTLIIIAGLTIIVIIVGIVLFGNQAKKEPVNNKTPNNSEVKDENGAFLFSIEDVFTITDRGTIVTGNVQRGKLKVGDTVQIVGLSKEILTTEVTGIEMFREQKDEAVVGDNVGIVLKDITRDQVQRGQVLAKPNSIIATTKFDADVQILSEESKTIISDKDELQFYFRTIDIIGVINLPKNIKKITSGEKVSCTITLESSAAMEIGTEFSIRENGYTIGNGKVTKLY